MRPRKVARRWASRGRSLARFVVIRTNSSGVRVISSGRPTFVNCDNPGAAHDGLPHQRHHRHAHPERIEARRMTVVRKRVETDIHLVIVRQIFQPRPGRHKRQPLCRDSLSHNNIHQSLKIFSGRRQQHQLFAIRESAAKPRPTIAVPYHLLCKDCSSIREGQHILFPWPVRSGPPSASPNGS